MAPTLVHAPFHRDGWVYEEKADGWRIVAYKDGEQVRLLSRNGRDHTRRFRDIAGAISKLLARSLVLDGEDAWTPKRSRGTVARQAICVELRPDEIADGFRVH